MLISHPIIQETNSYRLFSANNAGDPGYLTLQPKSIGDRSLWMTNVEKYCKLFQEPNNMTEKNPALEEIALQPNQWQSYNVRGGTIRLNRDLKEIAVQETHPERNQVIHDMLQLYWNASKGVGSQRRFY